MTPARTTRNRAACAGAFTIVEVLATLTLATIVLPPAVNGILLCMATAGHARRQVQAASLAQSKMAEIVTAGEFDEAEMTGDFGEELPEYTWTAEAADWEDPRLTQLDVSVTWTRRGQERQVSLSTLVYTGSSRE